jgi:hypothetical protein
MPEKVYVEIEIEDEHDIFARMERMEHELQGEARRMIDDLAEFTENWLKANVPIYDTYLFRHIDSESARWVPGGPGGGGEWQSVAGIKRGRSAHPLYVEFGTGIYAGRRLIRARYDRAQASVIATGLPRLSRRAGGVVTFQKHGEPRRFRYWVRGQRGQHYFFYTWTVLNVYAHTRLLSARPF